LTEDPQVDVGLVVGDDVAQAAHFSEGELWDGLAARLGYVSEVDFFRGGEVGDGPLTLRTRLTSTFLILLWQIGTFAPEAHGGMQGSRV
jgi:hypothetical protein